MNLIDGELRTDARAGDRGRAFRSADGALTVFLDDAGSVSIANGSAGGRRVSMGVRPEHVSVRATDARGETRPSSVRGTLVSVEPLGHEILVRVSIGTTVLTARTPPVSLPAPGTTVVANLDAAHLSLLRWPDGRDARLDRRQR